MIFDGLSNAGHFVPYQINVKSSLDEKIAGHHRFPDYRLGWPFENVKCDCQRPPITLRAPFKPIFDRLCTN